MISIYIEIIFRALYPPITSFYLHLFPLKIKFSPVIRQHTIYIFQPFFNYNFYEMIFLYNANSILHFILRKRIEQKKSTEWLIFYLLL